MIPFIFRSCALVCLLALAGCKPADSVSSSGVDTGPLPPLIPDAGGIQLSQTQGLLKKKIYITFPVDMVQNDLIEAEDAAEDEESASAAREIPSPVVIDPSPDHTFRWLSPRRGVIQTGYGIPEVAYRLTLRSGLQDVEGHAVNPQGWGAELASEDFGIVSVRLFDANQMEVEELSQTNHLSARPRARLEFSRDVLPADVAERVAFIDAESGERHAVIACLEEWQTGKPQGLIFVQPRKELTAGRNYWLVVERLQAARGDYQTQYLRVYPAGQCQPLLSKFARGYNQPREGSYARVFFNQSLDARQLDAKHFKVTPEVAGLTVKAERKIAVLKGDFRQGINYVIQVEPGIESKSGFKTHEAKQWTVTIPERRPSIIMPSDFLAQRYSAGVDVSLSHCRTQALTWKLAEVPLEKLTEVRKRLREFAAPVLDDQGIPQLDPRDGSLKFTLTDSLIQALELRVAATDQLPAAPGEEEVARNIRWKPTAGSQVAGLYLLEVEGSGVDGRLCGNRTLISLSDWYMNFIATGEDRAVRLSSLAGGAGVSGITVQAFSEEGQLMDEAVTEADGMARFQKLQGQDNDPYLLAAGNASGWCFQQGDYSTVEDHQFSTEGEAQCLLVTNGDLYEPGEEVQIYALVRERGDGGLTLPEPGSRYKIQVSLGAGEEQEDVEELPLTLSSSGGGSAMWKIPKDQTSSWVTFKLMQDEGDQLAVAEAGITEFRPPTFSADLKAETMTGTRAEARLTSHFFHGSANRDATVTWTAEWVMQDWLPESGPEMNFDEAEPAGPGELNNFTPAGDSLESVFKLDYEDEYSYAEFWSDYAFADRFSPAASQQGLEGVFETMKLGSANFTRGPAVPASHPVRGEQKLNETGELVLVSECPFPNLGRSHRAQVFWTVDVKTEAGQSRRAAATQHIQFAPQALAIYSPKRALGEPGVPILLTTINAEGKQGSGGEADLEMYRRTINTVHERVSEHVMKYRNVPEFRSVWKQKVRLPFDGVLPAAEPGDYVVCATPVNNPQAVPVSTFLHGVQEQTDLVLTNDTTFEAVLEKDPVTVGSTAKIQVRTAFPGAIRVSVETDDLLETLPLFQMKGTSAEIEVPIRKEYFPNAFIRLHLMGQPDESGKPAERFAICPVKVMDPEVQLTVTPKLDVPNVRVREQVTGHVLVQSAGQPVPNADVLVFAIDESILSLGNWKLPDPTPSLYPERMHNVRMNVALGAQWSEAQVASLSQFEKGFILGSGREKTLVPTVILRENEKPRPLWQVRVRTDAAGRAAYAFEAPDTLTSYRISALAHTATSQVGIGETSVKVSNPLRVEPTLPQFVREGDELELRCQLTQEAQASLPVNYSIEVEGNATLLEGGQQQFTLTQGKTQVASAKLRVGEAGVGSSLRLIFKGIATDASALSDGTAITLSLLPRYAERTEIVTGDLPTGTAWDVAASTRPAWSQEAGSVVDVMLSGTQWLPHLVTFSPGKRVRSKNVLLPDLAAEAFTPLLVPELGAYLPWVPDSPDTVLPPPGDEPEPVPSWLRQQATTDAADAVATLEKSIIPDEESGWFPRFPNSGEPNDPVTALVTLAVQLTKNREETGEDTASLWSERLATKLSYWRKGALNPNYRAGDQAAATPFVRSLALLAEAYAPDSYNPYSLQGLAAVVRSLFTHREEDLGLEGRCFLAMAVHVLQERPEDSDEKMPLLLTQEEMNTLLAEIKGYALPRGLDSTTLTTPQRAAAIRLLTLSTLAGQEVGEAARLTADQALQSLVVDDRQVLAQENIWRLLAASAFLKLEQPAPLSAQDLGRDDYITSANGVTLGWLRRPVNTLPSLFQKPLAFQVPTSWLLRASYRAASPEPIAQSGLALTREVYTHKAPDRKGSTEAPLRLGDFVLLTYRIQCDKPQNFVVIEEELPAALESLNPDLPSVRKAFSLPENPREAKLSHADHSSHRVRVVFDSLPAGESTYTVLTQVVGNGTFSWPAAQASLLYDQRINASTADAKVLAAQE
ncbi:alpha-2-macroglobulin family protein [Prosthecobacter dejongeii]|uniref:Uncharacterized protein YfaS (Alpha-2-macroglobulin family) n=1 Tax=Prosthecobacter dejongeii TaxID=48465 RepID=A0A7W7YKB2_9BACT|nr:alpha-2-macroglobulin family protein [Prosthecobacter dejongeii]MBB5037572.1 uncharacterized protein YfaS (alpha-2-macroglobulin family) [Prosthecobacter dejongeii]